MAIEHSITFGGVNSADFGIYISGEGVFNAPKRDVEMISIPGRNGEIALDKGRYENIEVTYPAFNYEADYSDFAQNLADFRNAICSQVGYQRLTDTFHPDEYRMATYIDGLEIKPIKYNTASEFEIKFNCKPQRWLASGETPVVVTSGDTLTNPTLYESSPLLEVGGYGHIQMGDSEVNIEDMAIGEVTLFNGGAVSSSRNIEYNTSAFNLMNDGDTITLEEGSSCYCGIGTRSSATNDKVTALTFSIDPTSEIACQIGDFISLTGGHGRAGRITIIEPVLGAKGARTEKKAKINFNATYTLSGVTKTATGSFDFEVYFGSDFISVGMTYGTGTLPADLTGFTVANSDRVGTVMGNSTRTVTEGNNTFIDCDLGEAYTIIDGEISSLNAYIDLGSDLPTLGTGVNEITYDDTVTELKISPKWWKL